MNEYCPRLDGQRSYEAAIRAARAKLLEPTNRKLYDAIATLRKAGVLVRHIEGEGIAALWNVGELRKVGYFEVIRMSRRAEPKPDRDRSMRQLKEWPNLGPHAFK